MKTGKLTGAALDWAVAKCEPDILDLYYSDDEPLYLEEAPDYHQEWNPSTNWAQGGPIIEREGMGIDQDQDGIWFASYDLSAEVAWGATGPTPLVAAMRCYVASKLGDEVEIPDILGDFR